MNANDIWLIAGLGNPEAKYDGTRHNAGFAALDSLAGKWGISVSKTKFQGLWGQGEVDGHKVVPSDLTLKKRAGAENCYDFSAALLTATDSTAAAQVSGTITMVKEEGRWKASAITLNL